MAKTLYSKKNQFSIIFCFPVEDSNEMVKWERHNFLLPETFIPPTFKDVHNAFLALDTAQPINVLDALGIEQYGTSTNTKGTTKKYSEVLDMKSDIIYYVK